MWLDKLGKREKIGVLVSMLVISAAFLDRIVIKPVQLKMHLLNQDTVIAERELSQYLRDLNQKGRIEKEYDEYSKYMVKRTGSEEEEVAKILGEIEELTRTSNLHLADMKPQTPKKNPLYKKYEIDIEAEGDMASIMRFLYQLNKSDQLLRAEKLKLSLKRKGTSDVKAVVLITKILQ